jgi:hypothetical protein
MNSITAQLQNIPIRKEFLGYKDAAIYNTIAKIKDIINKSYQNPYVRRWAEQIVADVTPNDKLGEVKAMHDFVKFNVRYTKDPYGIEYLQTPPVLLQQIEQGQTPSADCDDMTMLSLSLLKSIGFPVAVKVTSYSPNKKFAHIYGLANVKGQWIPVECVRYDKQLGWEAPNATRVLEKIV